MRAPLSLDRRMRLVYFRTGWGRRRFRHAVIRKWLDEPGINRHSRCIDWNSIGRHGSIAFHRGNAAVAHHDRAVLDDLLWRNDNACIRQRIYVRSLVPQAVDGCRLRRENGRDCKICENKKSFHLSSNIFRCKLRKKSISSIND